VSSDVACRPPAVDVPGLIEVVDKRDLLAAVIAKRQRSPSPLGYALTRISTNYLEFDRSAGALDPTRTRPIRDSVVVPRPATIVLEERNTMRAVELATEFGITGVLDFVSTQHGLVKAAISLDDAVGELYLQGAQVTAWQPRDERPVLFTSPKSIFAPGKAIRGGIPIIFPWFGPSRHAPVAPQHGFARTATWHLDGVETAGSKSLTMTLSLTDGDVGSTIWPEPFRAIYTVTFAQTLLLRLAVQNRARHPIVFEEALHTYFAISDISNIAISGLAGTTYIDKTDAALRKPQTIDLVTITAETDRVYLDTPVRCVIEDRGWRRRVVIEKDGAASTVVWNPGAEKAAAMADLGDPAWRGMVCVEAGNIADNEVRLAQNAERQMSTAISIDTG
jgi:glucose-6-phosphate 1-epimerase